MTLVGDISFDDCGYPEILRAVKVQMDSYQTNGPLRTRINVITNLGNVSELLLREQEGISRDKYLDELKTVLPDLNKEDVRKKIKGKEKDWEKIDENLWRSVQYSEHGQIEYEHVERLVNYISEFVRDLVRCNDESARFAVINAMEKMSKYVTDSVRKSGCIEDKNYRTGIAHELIWVVCHDPSQKNKERAREVIESMLWFGKNRDIPNFDSIGLLKRVIKDAESDEERQLCEDIHDKWKEKLGYEKWHMRKMYSSKYVAYLRKELEGTKDENEQIFLITSLLHVEGGLEHIFYALKKFPEIKVQLAVINALRIYNIVFNDELVESAIVAKIEDEKTPVEVKLAAINALSTCKSMDAWYFCEKKIKEGQLDERFESAYSNSRYEIWKLLVASGEFDPKQENWDKYSIFKKTVAVSPEQGKQPGTSNTKTLYSMK
ncbi:MAG: hypothetical protein WC492_02510 [Candidatus Micrarchaeia archaeon]